MQRDVLMALFYLIRITSMQLPYCKIVSGKFTSWFLPICKPFSKHQTQLTPWTVCASFKTWWRAICMAYRHLGNPDRTMVTYWYWLFLASYPRTPYRTWQEAPHLQTGNFLISCQPFAERLKSLKQMPPILMDLHLQLLSWWVPSYLETSSLMTRGNQLACIARDPTWLTSALQPTKIRYSQTE